MRTVLAFFLSFVFSLNAAYAGVAAICDAVDHLSKKEAGQHFHVGQHSHDSAEAATAATPQDDGGPQKTANSAANHCHAHGASGSVALVTDMTVPLLCGTYLLVASPSASLVSIPSARLDRPPRVSRA